MKSSSSDSVDMLVIGGGINGCGIAADAAGRGLSVTLCEQGDLAQGTSSASSKLIHGGLRYLEYYKFGLVRKSLKEREVLLRVAPHIIRATRFLLPFDTGRKPAWVVRLGLFVYDHLGVRKILPGTKTRRLQETGLGAELRSQHRKAFEYSDCTVDDSRLVVLNAVAARDKGAKICCRHRVLSARRRKTYWTVRVRDMETGKERDIRSKVLVNATGPWIGGVVNNGGRLEWPDFRDSDNASLLAVRLVKGSHIVVPKLFEHENAFMLQNGDGRIVFVIPFERDFSLVGTTDVDFEGDLDRVQAEDSEVDYLCDCVNNYFKMTISRDDVIWKFAGVRSLSDDGASTAQEATRDYELKLDRGGQEYAPLLSVVGGKITTYRILAEDVLHELETFLPAMSNKWTDSQPLPGGDLKAGSIEEFTVDLEHEFPGLDEKFVARLARNYGSRARQVIGDSSSMDGLGQRFGADLYEAEVQYLVDHEWATTADDILWRRSKLGLRFSAKERALLDAWLVVRERAKIVRRHAAPDDTFQSMAMEQM